MGLSLLGETTGDGGGEGPGANKQIDLLRSLSSYGHSLPWF